MKEGILVVDIGTSKVHANVIDVSCGETLLSTAERFKWVHPKEGWSEVDVNFEWEKTQDAVEYIVEHSKGKIDIKAVVLSTIGAGLLFMDKNGDPVGNMILAMDVRAINEGIEIYEGFGKNNEKFNSYKPGGVGGMFPPSKVLWMKKNQPEDFERVAVIGHVQQFLTWKLGFGPVTDCALAAGGGLFNAETMKWDSDFCDFIGFPVERMGPEPIQADSVLGKIQNFGRVKFEKELPVILGTYDVAAGLLGLGCLPGSTEVLGDVTGTFEQIGCLVNDKSQVKKNHFPLFCGPLESSYIVLGALVSGPNLDWFVNTFYPEEGLAAINRLFETYPFDGMNKVFLSKDINCGQGTFRGLNLNSTAGDLFKSIIEGLTFPFISTVEGLEKLNGKRFGRLRVGGGSANSDKWSQLKADVFDITVEKVKNIEITSVGCAIIAAVGIGLYPDYQTAIDHMVGVVQSFEPNHELTARYHDRYMEYVAQQQ